VAQGVRAGLKRLSESSAGRKILTNKFGATTPLDFVVGDLEKTGVGFGLLTASSIRNSHRLAKTGHAGRCELRIGFWNMPEGKRRMA